MLYFSRFTMKFSIFVGLLNCAHLTLAFSSRRITASLDPSSTQSSRPTVPPVISRITMPLITEPVIAEPSITGENPDPPFIPTISSGCTYPPTSGDYVLGSPITTPPWSRRTNSGLLAELKSECLLWDSSCSGNITAAAIKFFDAGGNGTQEYLFADTTNCFSNLSPDCPPALVAEIADLKAWMRTPQCVSDLRELYPWGNDDSTCCGQCVMGVGNVDVYYWPEPDSDTSCLSVIGSSIYPVDYGATTATFPGRTTASTYWGCTSQVSCYTPNTFVTASLIFTNSGRVSWKQYASNPWKGPQSCPTDITTPTPAILTTAPGSPASLHARGHSLLIQSSVAWLNGSRVSTLVSGTFTL